MARKQHREGHVLNRIGWLRAGVLGANDGIVSTGSLIIGVAASSAGYSAILISGIAGLVAGAMSMATGEYVSVSSQADTEAADIAREKEELRTEPNAELRELTAIYRARGLEGDLAAEVARQLTRRDAVSAHARDELGISKATSPRPVQAAFASAIAFSGGAAVPLLAVLFSATASLLYWVAAASLLSLGTLGAIGAWTGGAKPLKAVIRVTFWGALAMAVTAASGWFFGPIS